MAKIFLISVFAAMLLFIAGCTQFAQQGNVTNATLNATQNTQPGTGNRLCGDRVCDEIEKARGICPQDCANATQNWKPENSTNLCGDGICDSTEKTKGVCPKDCGEANFSIPRVEPVTANVSVDYSQELGEFSPFIFGTTSAPYFDQDGFDLSQEAGFRVIEVMYSIEGNNVPADADDPSDYDFSQLDKEVEAIFEAGAEPLILFGPGKKPANVTAYATFAANTAKHLTQGWNNGHYRGVRLFRFGNEPEGDHFWNGTREEFFETYAAWAEALKEVNESFVLDAPGFMNIHETKFEDRGISVTNDTNTFALEFLEYCEENNVPLDIFSFHLYSASPYEFYDDAKLAASIVANYSGISPLYGTPKLGNDEWNLMVGDLWSGSYQDEFDSAYVAANNINGLINMVEQGLSLSIRYGGTFNGGAGNCHDFLLTGCDGSGKPAFYAFKAFNSLAGSTRLETEGTDHVNLAAMAGTKDGEIIIIISNYDWAGYLSEYATARTAGQYNKHSSEFGDPQVYDSFNLTIKNLPWDSSDTLIYEHYLVDDSHDLELVGNATLSGGYEINLEGPASAPSVHLIKIRKK